MDVSNLGVLWETEQAIRDHLRSTADGDLQVLFKEKTKETVKDACVPHVHALLKIALQKTVETDGMPPPPIHPLREQLEQLYQRCGRTGIGEDQIVADSWWVRKFIGLVKMKVRKRKVSVCKAERLKRSRSRGLNILRASPTKRKVQSITEDADEAPEDREEPMERKCRKKKIPSGSSTDRKGRTRKTSGATGTPEPKGRAKPKGKSKPKAKAKPKAKGKARAKAQSQKGPEEVAEEFRSDSKSSSEQFTDISNFLDRFEPYEKVQDKRFKSFARSLIPDLEKHSLDNIYWTRGNVGITKLETGKDILHFSFNQSSATDAQKMAVSIKCAIIAAQGLDKGLDYRKDGPLTEKLKHNAQLVLFLAANKM
ncbi:unnamed protein product [Durusdinium trenchii]|uniref:Uncharacterized protein n=1 Tax=Durusdinium trenchii TaxID=1381693 RepID=A0ABP0T1V0_9DINO